MKAIIGLCAASVMVLGIGTASADTSTADSGSTSTSAATGINQGVNQGITFNSNAPDTATVYRAPSIGIPQSGFGFSNQNCGASSTGGVSTPWGAIGASDTHMMLGCNTRADVAVLWNMGAQRVAKNLMFCNGRDQVRVAFEQAGGICPAGSSAKGMYTNRNKETEPNAYVYGTGPQLR